MIFTRGERQCVAREIPASVHSVETVRVPLVCSGLPVTDPLEGVHDSLVGARS
ncbi:hypothetical protein SAMN05428945_6034 [Streptomyces sp. 2224.1]|nr:hypothetical protein BX261_6504 [Streptomyces sp. 2321.6]SDQ84982.1 hypothetical protein SAMN05216511_0746 [Streptomyces sp. KS_16]SED66425.1 hypothetical protein SAMN05428954_0721 [Streptomyces sp. 2112.3]SED91683.1 hypothetical protein SAMN05428945_6034 [Streptomyces sp. 2224.1]SED97943.1 hypothetical protein SAMN05428940_6530 [Streptomyces sp. 2133.1]SNC73335.1 hypothetical protein SAMN06272741_6433 [Streptomyces sp. 2114.4]